MVNVRTAALLCALVVLAGCGGPASSHDAVAPVARTEFVPVGTYVVTSATEAGARHPFVPGTTVRLRFANHQLVINAGCNTMSGRYSYLGTRLTVAPLASSLVGCLDGRAAQDAWLAGLFAKPVRLIGGKDAAIISGDVVLALAG